MSRHVADTDHAAPGQGRVKQFRRIELDDKPKAATLAAQRRKLSRGEERLRAYVRIERGRQA